MPEPIMPNVLSMLLCDLAWYDPRSLRYSLLGAFSTLGAPEVPYAHENFYVFFEILGGRGSVPFKVRIVNITEELVVADTGEQQFLFTDPVLNFPGAACFPKVVFPETGEYRVQLVIHERVLAERRLLISQSGVS